MTFPTRPYRDRDSPRCGSQPPSPSDLPLIIFPACQESNTGPQNGETPGYRRHVKGGPRAGEARTSCYVRFFTDSEMITDRWIGPFCKKKVTSGYCARKRYRYRLLFFTSGSAGFWSFMLKELHKASVDPHTAPCLCLSSAIRQSIQSGRIPSR